MFISARLHPALYPDFYLYIESGIPNTSIYMVRIQHPQQTPPPIIPHWAHIRLPFNAFLDLKRTHSKGIKGRALKERH